MNDVSRADTDDDLISSAGLVDVSDRSFVDLVNAHGDSPVERSISRLRQDLDDPYGVLSAFSSFLGEP